MNTDFKTNNFDLLRLFAAIEVLLLHSYVHLLIPLPAAFKVMNFFPGVPMFFTMSGFLISASLERNHNLKIYFKNRALRIFPALWMCVILSVIVISIVGKISFVTWPAIPWFFSQLIGFVYTPTFLKGYGFGSYNGSLWTIPLELQFYICLPIAYYITSKLAKKESKKTLVILGIFIIFFALTYYFKAVYGEGEVTTGSEPFKLKVLRYTFIPNIYPFILGVLLQRFKVYQSAWCYGKGLFWIAGYLAVCYFLPQTNTLNMFRFLVLSVTTISIAYTAPGFANKLLRGNDISYGIYIYHGLILGVIVQLKLLGNSNYIILILVLAVILAVLSWQFVEKPFIKKKKKTIHVISE